MTVRVERVRHASCGDIPLIVDSDGLPRPDANEFLLGHLSKAANTLDNEARALLPLLDYMDQRNIDIWHRISSGTGFTEAEFRGGVVEALRRDRTKRKTVQITVSPEWFNMRLTTALSFLRWYHHQALVRVQGDDRLRERIQESLDRIERMCAESHIAQSPKSHVVEKNLTDDEQAFLVAALDPKSGGIGENLAVQYRNYVALMLMFSCGLRRGEVLSLKVEDAVLKGGIPQINVTRRAVDPNDQRRPRPGVKRNGRPIPLDKKLARAIQQYIRNWRNKLLDQASEDTDYLILNKDGSPLSLRGLNAVFERIRNAYPDQLPSTFSPHTYRHTFSINFERQCRAAGMSEETRQHALMYLRGDSSPKSQEEYIEAEVREEASKQLLNHQKTILDSAAKKS